MTFETQKEKFNDVITLIAPRHIERSREIIETLNSKNLRYVCHSESKKIKKNTDVYLVDTYGESKSFYKISNVVFLGGSLVPKGGQNPLEALRFGCGILHGNHTFNFKDIYKLLKLLHASKKVNTPKQLASSITFKKNKKIGMKIKNIGEKILKGTIKELDNIIKNEIKKT